MAGFYAALSVVGKIKIDFYTELLADSILHSEYWSNKSKFGHNYCAVRNLYVQSSFSLLALMAHSHKNTQIVALILADILTSHLVLTFITLVLT